MGCSHTFLMDHLTITFLVMLLGVAAPCLGSRRVRTICFGDVIDQYGGFNSFVVIRTDPAIDATLVPSRPDFLGSRERAYRNMRVYMPRSYDRLVRDYDLIVSSDADRSVFRTDWIDWIAKSVEEGGLGLEWLGSIEAANFPSWEGTVVTEVLPCEQAPDLNVFGSFKVIIKDHDDPLMRVLDWQKTPPLVNINTQLPKQGSSVLALTTHPKGYPLITYWSIGRGSALCFASKFPVGVTYWCRDWNYFPEAMIFLSYRTVGRPIPENAALFSELISEFGEYDQRKSMVMSAISFVEKFGGRADKLYEQIAEMGRKKSAAEEVYLSGDYGSALDQMRAIRNDQQELIRDAMKTKDAALLWVYATEWCALTATTLLCAVVLWTLMVKRRLYREVSTSRLRAS